MWHYIVLILIFCIYSESALDVDLNKVNKQFAVCIGALPYAPDVDECQTQVGTSTIITMSCGGKFFGLFGKVSPWRGVLDRQGSPKMKVGNIYYMKTHAKNVWVFLCIFGSCILFLVFLLT